MSKRVVRFTVELTVKEGHFAAFEAIVQTMITDTQKEPGALGYEFHLSAGATEGIRQQHGILNVAVELIQEVRDEE